MLGPMCLIVVMVNIATRCAGTVEVNHKRVARVWREQINNELLLLRAALALLADRGPPHLSHCREGRPPWAPSALRVRRDPAPKE